MNSALKKHITSELIEGNRKAFETIYYQYHNALLCFATSYVKRREDASDIVQSVFLGLWERRQTLHPDSNIASYLFTSARNQCLNFLNHLKAQGNYISAQEQNWKEIQLNIYALEAFNSAGFDYEALELKLRNAVESLPESCSEVFMMSRYQGLKYTEIADKLHISVKTVEKKMSQALAHLRKELRQFFFLLFL